VSWSSGPWLSSATLSSNSTCANFSHPWVARKGGTANRTLGRTLTCRSELGKEETRGGAAGEVKAGVEGDASTDLGYLVFFFVFFFLKCFLEDLHDRFIFRGQYVVAMIVN
jgi:hypothetical protein